MLQNSRGSDNEWKVNSESVRQPTDDRRALSAVEARVCAECADRFYPTRKVDARHPAKFCSILCSARNAARRGAARTHAIYPQDGASNFNFKGWRSRNASFYARRFKAAHPEKYAAHRAVALAVRRKKLIRPEFCESCLKRCKVQAHHDDYSKPLVVDWLCRACHRVADSMRRSLEIIHAAEITPR